MRKSKRTFYLNNILLVSKFDNFSEQQVFDKSNTVVILFIFNLTKITIKLEKLTFTVQRKYPGKLLFRQTVKASIYNLPCNITREWKGSMNWLIIFILKLVTCWNNYLFIIVYICSGIIALSNGAYLFEKKITVNKNTENVVSS